jgi:hypothetical protein
MIAPASLEAKLTDNEARSRLSRSHPALGLQHAMDRLPAPATTLLQ